MKFKENRMKCSEAHSNYSLTLPLVPKYGHSQLKAHTHTHTPNNNNGRRWRKERRDWIHASLSCYCRIQNPIVSNGWHNVTCFRCFASFVAVAVTVDVAYYVFFSSSLLLSFLASPYNIWFVYDSTRNHTIYAAYYIWLDKYHTRKMNVARYSLGLPLFLSFVAFCFFFFFFLVFNQTFNRTTCRYSGAVLPYLCTSTYR